MMLEKVQQPQRRSAGEKSLIFHKGTGRSRKEGCDGFNKNIQCLKKYFLHFVMLKPQMLMYLHCIVCDILPQSNALISIPVSFYSSTALPYAIVIFPIISYHILVRDDKKQRHSMTTTTPCVEVEIVCSTLEKRFSKVGMGLYNLLRILCHNKMIVFLDLHDCLIRV